MTKLFQAAKGTKFQSRKGSRFQAWGLGQQFSQCVQNMEVVLSGITLCGCKTGFGVTVQDTSAKAINPSINGTYQVPFDSSTTNGGIAGSNRKCRYVATITDAVTIQTFDNPSCAAPSNCESTLDLTLRVDIEEMTDGTVKLSRIRLGYGSTIVCGLASVQAFNWVGLVDISDGTATVGNELTCIYSPTATPPTFHISETGTAKVTLLEN